MPPSIPELIQGRPRRRALLAAKCLGIAGLAYGGMAAAIRLGGPSEAVAMACGILIPVCAVALFAGLANLIGAFASPWGLILVASGPVPMASRLIHGEILSRSLGTLDSMAGPGEPLLSQYVELGVREGIARHDPEELIEVVLRLRSRAQGTDVALDLALSELAAALGLARDAGVSCCFVATGSWTSLIETNLHLYFVAY